ncbi:MAG: glycosyltransferase [Bacteroidales bacterium]|jgi:glycosyltransferase involved in cell wall biosynthesis|nr:glycosyltransferase [Bacteroidales bacterium]
MKILFLLSRFPYPLTKGDKLRSYNQMKYLEKENEIFMFCLNKKKIKYSTDNKPYHLPFLQDLKVCDFNIFDAIFGIIKAFLQNKPLQVGYYTHKRNIKKFENYVKQISPDVIYVQFVRMAEYCNNIKVKKVLDYQDALSANMLRRSKVSNPFFRPIFIREAKLLRNYEKNVFFNFDLTTIITNTDRQEIDISQKDKILIVPNGIDISYFNYKLKTADKIDILFCGNMSYSPNVDAAKYLVHSIMPLVWDKFPNIHVMIAGATPKKSVLRLKSNKVYVSGYVEDMKECYANAKIFVAALRTGSGLQNKLLEAMAIGTPVITSVLANKALGAVDKEHLLVADSIQEYANLIIKLLNDELLRKTLVYNAQNFVRKTYNWDIICQDISANIQVL